MLLHVWHFKNFHRLYLYSLHIHSTKNIYFPTDTISVYARNVNQQINEESLSHGIHFRHHEKVKVGIADLTQIKDSKMIDVSWAWYFKIELY